MLLQMPKKPTALVIDEHPDAIDDDTFAELVVVKCPRESIDHTHR